MKPVSARAAQPPEALPRPPKPTTAPLVAFAVMDTPEGFVPCRLSVAAGVVVAVDKLHEPMNYRALAYEYLQGDVSMHYESTMIEEAQNGRST